MTRTPEHLKPWARWPGSAGYLFCGECLKPLDRPGLTFCSIACAEIYYDKAKVEATTKAKSKSKSKAKAKEKTTELDVQSSRRQSSEPDS